MLIPSVTFKYVFRIITFTMVASGRAKIVSHPDYKTVRTYANFSKARTLCNSFSTSQVKYDLATFPTFEHFERVRAKLTKEARFWIGFRRDLSAENKQFFDICYRKVNPYNYSLENPPKIKPYPGKWHPWEPNNAKKDENCVELAHRGGRVGGCLNDFTCFTRLYPLCSPRECSSPGLFTKATTTVTSRTTTTTTTTTTTQTTSSTTPKPKCQRGTYVSHHTQSCVPCPTGHFQDELDQRDCIPCPPERPKTRTTGSSSVKQCLSVCEVSSYCQNGGTCIPPSSGKQVVRCKCPDGYSGVRCRKQTWMFQNIIFYLLENYPILNTVEGVMYAFLFTLVCFIIFMVSWKMTDQLLEVTKTSERRRKFGKHKSRHGSRHRSAHRLNHNSRHGSKDKLSRGSSHRSVSKSSHTSRHGSRSISKATSHAASTHSIRSKRNRLAVQSRKGKRVKKKLIKSPAFRSRPKKKSPSTGIRTWKKSNKVTATQK